MEECVREIRSMSSKICAVFSKILASTSDRQKDVISDCHDISRDLECLVSRATRVLLQVEQAHNCDIDADDLDLALRLAEDSQTSVCSDMAGQNDCGESNSEADDKWNEELFDDESDVDDSWFEEPMEQPDTQAAQKTSSDVEELASTTADLTDMNVDRKYLEVLNKYFGFKSFKPMQWKIIDSVMNLKRDSLVLMATGYGKSLCYQYASVYTGRCSVVVSPLLSLMEDQVLALTTSGIPACQLSSMQDDNLRVKQQVLAGDMRIVYMTPERITTDMDFVVQLNSTIGIDLIAIDEAHCVSQWGHDFRDSYRMLDVIKRTLPAVPVLALTATATHTVKLDICKSLRLKSPLVMCTGFDRPNLYLSVTLKSPSMANDFRSVMKRRGSDNYYSFDGPTVIYCPTRKKTEDCLKTLQTMGVNCSLYHAGLPYEQRRRAHKQFVNDKVPVIIATVAFGMGIDKPDVRTVIHYGAPKDIESYYQEIGRAGRDGLRSNCITFYSTADFALARIFLKDIKSQTFLDHKMEMIRKMETYLSTTSCRRKEILAHFEDEKSLEDVGGTELCCDNCGFMLRNVTDSADTSGSSPNVDVGTDALLLFKAVQACKGRFGISVIAQFLKGSKGKSISKYEFLMCHPQHGSGHTKSEHFWKTLGRQLILLKYLQETPVPRGFGTTVSLSSEAIDWLQHNSVKPEMSIRPSMELAPFFTCSSKAGTTYRSADQQGADNSTTTVSTSVILPKIKMRQFVSTPQCALVASAACQESSSVVGELYEKLFKYRDKLSEESELQLSTYMIATNKNLVDIAKQRPTTLENLCKIDNLPQKRAELLGQGVLDLVKEFSEQKNLDTDVFEMKPTTESFIQSLPDALNTALWTLTETKRSSYLMFQAEGKSVSSVMSDRGLAMSTVVGHLSDALLAGLPLDTDKLGLTPALVSTITSAIRSSPVNGDMSKLSMIKQNLPEHIGYDQIKLVVAFLKYEYGMGDTPPSITGIMADSKASTGLSQSAQSGSSLRVASTSSSQNSSSLLAWMSSSSAVTPKPSNQSSQPPSKKKKKSVF